MGKRDTEPSGRRGLREAKATTCGRWFSPRSAVRSGTGQRRGLRSAPLRGDHGTAGAPNSATSKEGATACPRSAIRSVSATARRPASRAVGVVATTSIGSSLVPTDRHGLPFAQPPGAVGPPDPRTSRGTRSM